MEGQTSVALNSMVLPFSQEMIADSALPSIPEMLAMIQANARAFAALPAEEQARIEAERQAAYEAQRCDQCGCHPDEHGEY